MPTKVIQLAKALPGVLAVPNVSKQQLWNITWPYAAIVMAHLIWGINFIVAKITLQEIPPMSLAFLRFTMAIFLILPFLIFEKDKTKIQKTDLPWILLSGILMITFNIGLFYLGLEKTDAISAAVLTMTIPIASVLLGWTFLKEKVYVINLFGIFLGLIGAVLILGLPQILLGGRPFSPEVVTGDLLIILSSLAWVGGAIISKRKLSRYSPLTITTLIFAIGVITFLLPATGEYLHNPEWINKITYLGIFGLTFISVASSVSAFFLFEWGLKRVGIIKADLFQYIEPIVATFLGVWMLSEQIGFYFIVGSVLAILGVYWSTLGRESHKHPKHHRN
jgi:drug/metabolite transporter (DMT)-like permease